MKTGALTAIFGLLMLLLGGTVLFYDGTLSALVKPSGLDSMHPQHLLMSPVIGWFVLGTGAVLMGLKLHERKML